jgi:peptide/nickel transport system substrate-binding protein
MRYLHAATFALGGMLLAVTANAETLTIATAAPPTSLDPHYHNTSPNTSVSIHIFDRLVDRDARARPIPGLAESWKTISETVWELKLRPGVRWHDGRAFSAEDVAFSIARVPTVPNSPGLYAGYVRAITRVEIIDPLTVRLHTARPHPLMPNDLGAIHIASRHVGEGANTEDYNRVTAAIGTGPYRVTGYRAGERVEMVRNDAYWGGAEPWTRVNYRVIASDPARTAALLAGDVDLIDQVPSADLPRLRREPRVRISQIQGLRVLYLQVDFSRPGEVPGVTDEAGRPLPRNPFMDRRVRQALSLAIDRRAIADRVMEGSAEATGQWLPEGAFGHDPGIAVLASDPARARALLAEAGYPRGFSLTLHTPNERYPNDARAAQAVAQMWARIGLHTQVEALPWTTFSARRARQEFGSLLGGWGSSTGEASSMLVNVLSSNDRARRVGSSNHMRYSNLELDELTRQATETIDDERREALLRQAVRLAVEDGGLIPLVQMTNQWAMRRGLEHEPRMDERTLATGARPAR